MNLYKEFFQYVIPSMFAFALSGVYAIADGFFVGNALGDQALAAINIAYPLTAFLQSIGSGIGMGGAIQYAICIGAKDTEAKKRYFGGSILLLIGFSFVLMGVLLVLSPFILGLLGASGTILELGEEYIRFIAYGAIFQVMGTGMIPFIRNMGGAVTAMIAMIVGFITNILLDYLFVWVLLYGMMGAAIATVIGQAVTLFVCILFFLRKKQKPVFHIKRENINTMKRIILTGLSPFGLTFSPNITLILINKSAVIFGGDFAVTCYATVSYISCVVMLLLQGISDGSQPLISLFYGKGEFKKAKQIRNFSYYFAAVVSMICIIVLFLFRATIAKLFGASPEVAKSVAAILPIFLVGYLFVSFSRTTTSYFYATEKNAGAYLLIYGESICLLLLLLFLPNILTITGTWISVPVSQLCIMLVSIGLTYKWK
ncbi:Multidrug export protein MepA [Clostridiales bacterium CHKCI001]|nr:Multidrug export protein MepA [Clostridiales bacterium CHKCI001]